MAPDISTLLPNTTSVTVTWTQPEFSFPVFYYTISLTGENISLIELVDNATSYVFTDLEENTKYTFTVIANLRGFNLSLQTNSSINFTTLTTTAATGNISTVL